MARAEERREGEGKGRDELEHLEPILGFRFEMTEGLEWLGEGFKFWTFWSISFSITEISVIMNSGIQFGKTKKRKGVKSLLCDRYTI